MTELSRRGFLAATGGAIASSWLFADPAALVAAGEHAARAARAIPPLPFEYLTPGDAAEIEAAAAQIIPSDESPGAREARVVYFIDKSLATWAKDQRKGFADAVAELRKRARASGARTFAALTDAQQHAVIAALEQDKHVAFFTIRGATLAGMLSNPEYGGNFNKAGWKLIGFSDQFSWAPPFGWYDANER
ncbi:MAG TPA: gluconate 2-dehydrogenase subunit 3 family protein [Gemmatimonadaceae bacterium]|nr:gluconate 2-dehydrogenase subunit 3 family protein [Gemmatimonadaceae bacterium]